MAIASLILGIVGLCGALIPFVGFIGVPLGGIAIVLGVLARKKAREEAAPTGTATAGLVLGIIAVALGVLLFAACMACVKLGQQADQEAQHRMAEDPALKKQLDDFTKAVREGSAPALAAPPAPAAPVAPVAAPAR